MLGIDWGTIGYWTLLVCGILTLMLVNAVGVVLVALQLPGTWLMLLATVIAGWLTSLHDGVWIYYIPTFVILAVLALLGEGIEFLGGAAGAKIAGAGRRATFLAVFGSIAGAILGTFLLPIPIVGTLTGAALGAAGGSILGDRWEGRDWKASIHGGGGAAVGKLGGAVGKLAVAALMWVVVALATFV